MYDLDHLPTIIVSGSPFSQSVGGVGAALGMADSGGVASIGRMLSAQVELSNHTAEGLIEFLHRRTVTTRLAYSRSKRWWGRFYNRMSGEHPVYVQMNGHHLIQILSTMAQEDDITKIPRHAQCGIRVDVSENYLAHLKEQYYADKR